VHTFGVEGMRAIAGILKQDFVSWQGARVRPASGAALTSPVVAPAPSPSPDIVTLQGIARRAMLDAPQVRGACFSFV
jgi:hypothetical protein